MARTRKTKQSMQLTGLETAKIILQSKPLKRR